MPSDPPSRETENLQQFRMAVALVEQRLNNLVGEAPRDDGTLPSSFAPTIESSGVQFRAVADRRSKTSPVTLHRERRGVHK